MQTNWKQIFVVIGMAFLTGVTAHAQTDISASVFGTINSHSTGNGTDQSSSDSGGGMVGLRRIFSPLLGFEANFAVEGNKQALVTDLNSCGARCGNLPVSLGGTAFEFTGNYVVSGKFGKNLRPFAEAGLGFTYFNPTGTGYIGVNSESRPTWVGGGGADWNVAPHIGVRLQYRVNFYKAPDVYHGYSPTGVYANTQEPMVGVFFRL